MKTVGEKFAKEECFIPDLLLAADAMKIALDLVKPHIKTEKLQEPKRYVIGTVQGDIHDIGKNFVSFMLISAGFEIFDLGIDAPPRTFAEKAADIKADIVGSSAFSKNQFPEKPGSSKVCSGVLPFGSCIGYFRSGLSTVRFFKNLFY